MIDKLKKLESQLPQFLESPDEWNSIYVDYHKPFVERLWRQIGEDRLYLHKIYPCQSSEALLHSHPWPSAVKIVNGAYEMGVGYSSKANLTPEVTSKLVLNPGVYYEMLSPFDWHYVCPLDVPSYSLMTSGLPFHSQNRVAHPELKTLNEKIKKELLDYFRNFY